MSVRRRALQRHNKRLAEKIAKDLLPGTGFCLLTFTFGARGYTSYASNVQRADILVALKEFIARIEADDMDSNRDQPEAESWS